MGDIKDKLIDPITSPVTGLFQVPKFDLPPVPPAPTPEELERTAAAASVEEQRKRATSGRKQTILAGDLGAPAVRKKTLLGQ